MSELNKHAGTIKPTKRLGFDYAIGMFGTSIPINLLKTYAAVFYVDQLGLPTSKWAVVLLAYTFLDAIDNLIYGWLSDRTRTPIGRRRPWLFVATPLLVLGLILFFNPSQQVQSTASGLYLYALIIYMFTGTMDSLVNANYGALFPELFPDDTSRVATNAMRQGFQLIAMVISIALTPVVTQQIGYGRTSIIYGLLALVVILYMTIRCKELPAPKDERKPGLLESIKAVLTRWNFWAVGINNAFYMSAMSLVLAGMSFYTKYTLELSGLETTIMFAAVLLIAVVSIGIWAGQVRRLGLFPIWRGSILLLVAGFFSLHFATGLISAILCCVLIGLAYGGILATMDLLGARVVDEDKAVSGMRREGIISNALGFLNRLNGLFVSLGWFIMERAFGFISGDRPGPQPGAASRFLTATFPMIMMIFCFLSTFFIRFEDDKITLRLWKNKLPRSAQGADGVKAGNDAEREDGKS